MQYELTVKMTLKSRHSAEHVAKQFESLFEFGTIRESVADGLELDDDPHLVDVSVAAVQRAKPPQSGRC